MISKEEYFKMLGEIELRAMKQKEIDENKLKGVLNHQPINYKKSMVFLGKLNRL